MSPDASPTEGSDNPITSGAVHTALQSKADSDALVTGGAFSDNSLTLNRGSGDVTIPNVIESVSGAVDGEGNLTITINGVSSGGIPLGDLSTVGYDLTVTVTASDDTSVEGVTVQAVDGGNVFTGVTNTEGIAHIIITENGDYVISAVDVENTTTADSSVSLSGEVSIEISSVTGLTLTGTVSLLLRATQTITSQRPFITDVYSHNVLGDTTKTESTAIEESSLGTTIQCDIDVTMFNEAFPTRTEGYYYYNVTGEITVDDSDVSAEFSGTLVDGYDFTVKYESLLYLFKSSSASAITYYSVVTDGSGSGFGYDYHYAEVEFNVKNGITSEPVVTMDPATSYYNLGDTTLLDIVVYPTDLVPKISNIRAR